MTPATATVGESVTIHGTALANATVTLDAVPVSTTSDAVDMITFVIPPGVVPATDASATIDVTTPEGMAHTLLSIHP